MTAEDPVAALQARIRKLEHDVQALQKAVARLILERKAEGSSK